MITLFLYLHTLTCVTSFINAEARTFQNQAMCLQGPQVGTCSSQTSSPYMNSCLIYKTEACKRNEFPPWRMEPLYKPKLESNAEFTVVIEPYAFHVKELSKSDPISAINISLTFFNKNISGFSIILNKSVPPPPQNVCRIIDFRGSLDNIKVPFQFFYDCIGKLREDFWKDIFISFRAFPLNIELSYLVYIPRVSGKNSNSSCDWAPLLMIYHEGLQRNHIQLKFSNPQNDSSILFFLVTLLDSSDTEIDKNKLPSNIKNDMITTEFHLVKSGYYSISINVILLQKSCVVFRSESFFVGTEIRGYSFEIFIVVVIIIIVSACILIYYLCQRYLSSVVSVLKPSILLVYFHKQLHHEFLTMWAKYLEKHYAVNAYTLYKCGGNPKRWLDDIACKSNIIVFVLSEGLAQVFDEETSSCEEDHHWVEQLPEAKALINNLKSGEKMFCKICFPFSEKQHVPKCLKGNRGHLFKLLGKDDETENFLCYIFNCSSKFKLLNKLCCVKHHVKNTENMQKDLKELKEKLKAIKIQCGSVCDTSTNEGYSQDTLNKQSNLNSQANEKVYRNNLNVINENQDDVAADILRFEFKTFSQRECESNLNACNEESILMPLSSIEESENNSNICNEESSLMPSISVENCDNENAGFHQQGENVSDQSNEFLIRCIKKALAFE